MASAGLTVDTATASPTLHPQNKTTHPLGTDCHPPFSSSAITDLFSISVENCCLFETGLLCHFLLCIFELSSLKYLQLAVPTSWIIEVVLAQSKKKKVHVAHSCACTHTGTHVHMRGRGLVMVTDDRMTIRGCNRPRNGRAVGPSLDCASGLLVHLAQQMVFLPLELRHPMCSFPSAPSPLQSVQNLLHLLPKHMEPPGRAPSPPVVV